MNENKRDTLSDLLKQLCNEISNIYQAIEDDKSISDEQFKVYEKQIETLYSIHNDLSEEIYFA